MSAAQVGKEGAAELGTGQEAAGERMGCPGRGCGEGGRQMGKPGRRRAACKGGAAEAQPAPQFSFAGKQRVLLRGLRRVARGVEGRILGREEEAAEHVSHPVRGSGRGRVCALRCAPRCLQAPYHSLIRSCRNRRPQGPSSHTPWSGQGRSLRKCGCLSGLSNPPRPVTQLPRVEIWAQMSP